MPTYYINGQPPLAIELDAPPPCLFCGDPVVYPSTDGPLVCGLCDCGSNRDGSKWTEAQAIERWLHRGEQIAKYREASADRLNRYPGGNEPDFQTLALEAAFSPRTPSTSETEAQALRRGIETILKAFGTPSAEWAQQFRALLDRIPTAERTP